jgi:hypothetical protein
MDEDDDGKEVEHDVEKKEKKRKERLVFLMSENLSWSGILQMENMPIV